jgi:membrane associated rhomboid family serine protease
MGIYDREYYRAETSGSGWFSSVSPACKTIILINVFVFFCQAFFPDLQDYLAARSDAIFQRFQIWRLLTATFLHDRENIFHLVWNMLWLWFLGQEIESMYGTREFTKMYLTAAVFSTLIWAVCENLVPGARALRGQVNMLGASGAVNAVVVLYALYFPRREFLLFFILPVPVWALVTIYLAMDAFSLLQKLNGVGGAGAGVAVASHLGGALYGYLYKKYDLRWSRLDLSRARRPRLRIVKPDSFRRGRERDKEREPADRERSIAELDWGRATAASRPSPNVSTNEEQLDARLDEILAKIAREGRDSLNDEENRILQEASRRAQGRRSGRV